MTLGFWWSVSTLRTLQLKYFVSLFFAHPQICASVFYFFSLAHIVSLELQGGPWEAGSYCSQLVKSCITVISRFLLHPKWQSVFMKSKVVAAKMILCDFYFLIPSSLLSCF